MKTIFVLDDDADQADLIARALELPDRGWTVKTFTDPIRALATLNEERADLLIADLSMPWIDGGDVVATARVKHPDLPVIIVSGFARGTEIAGRHGVPFLRKPVDVASLRDAAARAFNRG